MFVFPVTDRTLHLSGGKVTFYFLSHIASLLRSCCKCALIVDFIPMYAMVSSANSSMVLNQISLICICCKLLEHIVVSSITMHANTYNIIFPLHHGFRKLRSCETQLMEFIDDVLQKIDINYTNMEFGGPFQLHLQVPLKP
jgi:hypothetical protein